MTIIMDIVIKTRDNMMMMMMIQSMMQLMMNGWDLCRVEDDV
jgi:hypothetical protein